jgi:hypothetical protein
METNIINEIDRLRQMTVRELRIEWERLYGEQTRSRNREYLWRRLCWRVQELRYGGLSAEAKERMLALTPATFTRSQVPPGFSPGAVSPHRSPGTKRRDRRLPSPGSTLVRRYKGVDIRVFVLDDGFEFDGRRYDSLSEIAFVVTGSRWNGWLFFGLTKRQRSR